MREFVGVQNMLETLYIRVLAPIALVFCRKAVGDVLYLMHIKLPLSKWESETHA